MISYNPTDIREEYCGFCHAYHDELDALPPLLDDLPPPLENAPPAPPSLAVTPPVQVEASYQAIPNGYCFCGRTLHYPTDAKRRWAEEQVREKGEFIPVPDSEGRKWRVQRHYLLLHGFSEGEPSTWGFKEIV